MFAAHRFALPPLFAALALASPLGCAVDDELLSVDVVDEPSDDPDDELVQESPDPDALSCGSEVETYKRQKLCEYDAFEDGKWVGYTNRTVCSAVAGTQILNFYDNSYGDSFSRKRELHRQLNASCSNAWCNSTGDCADYRDCCQQGYSSSYDAELRAFLTKHIPPPIFVLKNWQVSTEAFLDDADPFWDIVAELEACRPVILHTSGHPRLYDGDEHSVVVVDYVNNSGTRWDFLIVSDNDESEADIRAVSRNSIRASSVDAWVTTIKPWW